MAILPKMNAAAMAVGTLLMLGLCCCGVNSSPDMTRRLYQCNPLTYEDSDPYRRSVDYVLNVILTVTASTPGYRLYSQSPFHDYVPVAYGHGACRGSLAPPDCATCIQAAYNNIRDLCNGNIGGRVYLNDCTIRYEKYKFTETGF